MTLKIAVIGRHGQLATCLANYEPTGIEVYYLSRQDIDLLNPDSINAELSGIDIVINTAAYTNVELAEVEVEQAGQLNHLAVTRLAAASHQLGFRLLHISTDYVFDGRRQQPWTVDASPAPISAYGQSKYAGEQALKASAASFCIIRTSWLYADKGNNFVNTMLKLMAVRTELTVVDDQTGTPTLADNLARYIWALIQQNHWPEIVHFTDLGETTWYGFAREIQRQAIELGLLSASAICQLTPIASKDYPSRVQRPAYSALDMSQTPALTQAVQWQDALTQLLIKKAQRP